MIQYGKVMRQKKMEEDAKEKERKNQERINKEREQQQRLKEAFERKRREEHEQKQREEREQKQREENEQKQREEQERIELEAKKICREQKRLGSPVCPKKDKKCDKENCTNNYDLLCNNCNIHLCSECYKKSDPNDESVNKLKNADNYLNSACSECSMIKTVQIIQATDVMCSKGLDSDHKYDCFIEPCKHIYHKECLLIYLKKCEEKKKIQVSPFTFSNFWNSQPLKHETKELPTLQARLDSSSANVWNA
ncbi:hypothetical protein WDU94_007404 [Cyamophila willieti]